MNFNRAEAARNGCVYDLDPTDLPIAQPCACCGALLRPGDIWCSGCDPVRGSYCDHIRVVSTESVAASGNKIPT
jgi:hypothetical protein